MTPTDEQLQKAIAKEMPELIECIPHGPSNHFYFWRVGTECKSLVTPREWDWIVREMEKRLDNYQRIKYWGYLFDETDSQHLEVAKFQAAASTWQQRAIAYFLTKGIEI